MPIRKLSQYVQGGRFHRGRRMNQNLFFLIPVPPGEEATLVDWRCSVESINCADKYGTNYVGFWRSNAALDHSPGATALAVIEIMFVWIIEFLRALTRVVHGQCFSAIDWDRWSGGWGELERRFWICWGRRVVRCPNGLKNERNMVL